MDMKQLLLALDNPTSKPVKELDDMKKFMSIVSENSVPLKNYIAEAEQKTIDAKNKRQQEINKKAKRIAEAVYMNGHDTESKPVDKTDTVKVDIPLLIRLLEYAREDAQSDIDIHNVAEQMIKLNKTIPTLSMSQYETIIG
jgi:hypothetical protein